MKNINNRDALRRPIILGQIYGWSTDSSGWSTVSFGKAIKITEKGYVSLEIIGSYKALYNYNPETGSLKPKAKNTAVKPIKLFPLEEDLIMSWTIQNSNGQI